jgi:hypothetical protein
VLPPAVWRFPLLRHGTIGAFLNTAATSSAMTLAALYLQGTRHDSPLAAAVMLVPFSLAVVAGSASPRPPCTGSGPYGDRRGHLPAQLNTLRAREKATRSRRPAGCALCG